MCDYYYRNYVKVDGKQPTEEDMKKYTPLRVPGRKIKNEFQRRLDVNCLKLSLLYTFKEANRKMMLHPIGSLSLLEQIDATADDETRQRMIEEHLNPIFAKKEEVDKMVTFMLKNIKIVKRLLPELIQLRFVESRMLLQQLIRIKLEEKGYWNSDSN